MVTVCAVAYVPETGLKAGVAVVPVFNLEVEPQPVIMVPASDRAAIISQLLVKNEFDGTWAEKYLRSDIGPSKS